MNTSDTITQLSELLIKQHDADYTVGYLNSVIEQLIELLPKKKRDEFLKTLKYRIESNSTIEVRNLMTGEMNTIRLSDRGTCSDPSTNRYWSM